MDQSQNADTQGVTHAVEATQVSGQEDGHDVKPSIPETSQSTVVPDAEESRLRELQAEVRNQDDLERDIGRQVRAVPLHYTLFNFYEHIDSNGEPFSPFDNPN